MPINSNKPHRWKADITASVDCFNQWFLKHAPETFRATRISCTAKVEEDILHLDDLIGLTIGAIKGKPSVLVTLRMCTCPPIARDRLVGLADTTKGLVRVLEEGKLPPKMPFLSLDEHLGRIAKTLTTLLDVDLFPWLKAGAKPTKPERYRASTIVADRLCGSVSDPIIRNAQEKRQLELIRAYLDGKGYKLKNHSATLPLGDMEPGTYAFRMNILVGAAAHVVKIPIDAVVQPLSARPGDIPLLIEAKSAGDFTNVNKRRKEEAQKVRQIKEKFPKARFILFLCGYFDAGYLGYSANEGMDWIWEHRMSDMDKLGL
jgi:hypothetical protein